jgi:hypothetical protein
MFITVLQVSDHPGVSPVSVCLSMPWPIHAA